MQKARLLLLILLTVFSLVGCEKEDVPPLSEKHQLLIGDWKITDAKLEHFRSNGSYLGETPMIYADYSVRFTRDRSMKMQSVWPYTLEEKGGKSYVVITFPDNNKDSTEVALLTAQNMTLMKTKVYSDGSKDVSTEKLIRQ